MNQVFFIFKCHLFKFLVYYIIYFYFIHYKFRNAIHFPQLRYDATIKCNAYLKRSQVFNVSFKKIHHFKIRMQDIERDIERSFYVTSGNGKNRFSLGCQLPKCEMKLYSGNCQTA